MFLLYFYMKIFDTRKITTIYNLQRIKGDYMAKSDILTIEDIVHEAEEYLGEEDITFIRRAYEFAKNAHADQYRKSGEPYIIHPVQVAGILVELEMDPATIASGFLHDVVEDTDRTLDSIEEAVNSEVAMLVDGETTLGKLQYKSREALQAEN